jgi:hypothetical protein
MYEPYLLTALGERQLTTFRPSRPVSTTRRSRAADDEKNSLPAKKRHIMQVHSD